MLAPSETPGSASGLTTAALGTPVPSTPVVSHTTVHTGYEPSHEDPNPAYLASLFSETPNPFNVSVGVPSTETREAVMRNFANLPQHPGWESLEAALETPSRAATEPAEGCTLPPGLMNAPFGLPSHFALSRQDAMVVDNPSDLPSNPPNVEITCPTPSGSNRPSPKPSCRESRCASPTASAHGSAPGTPTRKGGVALPLVNNDHTEATPIVSHTTQVQGNCEVTLEREPEGKKQDIPPIASKRTAITAFDTPTKDPNAAFGARPVKARKLAPKPTDDNDVVIQEEDPAAEERKRVLDFINEQSKIYAPEFLENRIGEIQVINPYTCERSAPPRKWWFPLHKRYENSKEFHDQLQNGRIHTYVTVYKGQANQKAADHLKQAIGQLKAVNLVAEIEAKDYNIRTMLKDAGTRSNVLVIFSTPCAAQRLLLLPAFTYRHETTNMAFFIQGAQSWGNLVSLDIDNGLSRIEDVIQGVIQVIHPVVLFKPRVRETRLPVHLEIAKRPTQIDDAPRFFTPAEAASSSTSKKWRIRFRPSDAIQNWQIPTSIGVKGLSITEAKDEAKEDTGREGAATKKA
ncbi:hypothetical protein FRB99_006575 [Tulasnella sp. 403]|nr:hypothetical protein FRB99_006575 [Tulasnella sp. 403]